MPPGSVSGGPRIAAGLSGNLEVRLYKCDVVHGVRNLLVQAPKLVNLHGIENPKKKKKFHPSISINLYVLIYFF